MSGVRVAYVERVLSHVLHIDTTGVNALFEVFFVQPAFQVGWESPRLYSPWSMISVIGVLTCDGLITVTPIFLSLPSNKMFLLKPIMPCFEAREGLWPGSGGQAGRRRSQNS